MNKVALFVLLALLTFGCASLNPQWDNSNWYCYGYYNEQCLPNEPLYDWCYNGWYDYNIIVYTYPDDNQHPKPIHNPPILIPPHNPVIPIPEPIPPYYPPVVINPPHPVIPAPIPEPTTITLFGMGLGMLLIGSRLNKWK